MAEKETEQSYHFAAPSSEKKEDVVEQASFQPAEYVSEKERGHGNDLPDNVLRFGRQQYAIGLFWQPLQDVDDPVPEIRETMESDQSYNLYATYYGRAPQYGIGSLQKGHKAGMAAGAAAVLDSLSDRSSFIAVFKVRSGWWFLTARNDLILPEEDVLYHTEDEARDAFLAMLAVPDWGYKIAPAEWAIDDAEEMDLEKLLREGQQVRLFSLGAMRGMKILLIIAILTIVLVSAVVYVMYTFKRSVSESIF